MKKYFLIATIPIVTVLLLFLSLSLFFSSDNTKTVPALSSDSFEQKSGTFSYINNYTDTYYYSDGYFFGNSSEYNPQLATMSYCLALSSYSTEENGTDIDFSNNYFNVQSLLCDELGYTDFAANDMYSLEPTTDSIAVAVARKEIRTANGKPCTLIAVAVRGGGYKKEWTSNFTIGKSGQAKGFRDAKEQVLEFLRNYISENDKISGKIKLWITGISRGGATSNLVAAELTDNPDIFGTKITFSSNDIYAYCFATPMGARSEDILSKDPSEYENIWNVINRNDPIPYVAMKGLGFDRYGSEHYFPDVLTAPETYSSMQQKMEMHYRNFPTYNKIGEYSIDEFRLKKIDTLYLALAALDLENPQKYASRVIADDWQKNWTQGYFLDHFFDTFTKENICTRENYVTEFENGIRTISDTIFGSAFSEYPAETISLCFDKFIEKLRNPLNIAKIVYGIFESDNSPSKVITILLTESMNECGMNITSDKITELENFGRATISLITKFALNHPNLTATLLSNIKSIASGHNYELYFAWLKAEDKNYTPEPVSFCGTGSYRTIKVSDFSKVEVFNSENETVAIISDSPESLSSSSIYASTDENYNRIVVLPVTENYSVKITTEKDSSLDICVSEFSHITGNTSRTVKFSGIKTKQYDQFILHIPAFSVSSVKSGSPLGSDVNYELSFEEEIIPASSDSQKSL